MDIVKMLQNVDGILNGINCFYFYREQRKLSADWMILSIQNLCEIGLSDVLYWENTEVNFLKLKELGEIIQRAETAKDWVGISDVLYYDLLNEIKCIADVLFDKNGAELRGYFWRINKEALQSYHPELLEHIETIHLEKEQYWCRTYGIRGRVVYNIWDKTEFDLYSEYNPIGFAMQMAETLCIRDYYKIYIWGCNTGFEVNAIIEQLGGATDIEVYITDLIVFKQVLINTVREGVLSHPSVKWNFLIDLNDFIAQFDLQKKESSYIYICRNSGDDLTILEQFICNNSINSNIGETK